MQVNSFSNAASNLTETGTKILHRRAAYVTAHCEYLCYLCHLLDSATLPASEVPLPNMTTIAAMVAQMRAMHPTAPWLNGVVLGRVLHRVLPSPLLTWHGGLHSCQHLPDRPFVAVETTIYRFPEVRRSRQALENFSNQTIAWSGDVDQWRPIGQRYESDISDTVGMSTDDRSHPHLGGI